MFSGLGHWAKRKLRMVSFSVLGVTFMGEVLCVMTTNYNLPSDQVTEGHSESRRESVSGVTSLLVSRQEPSPSEGDKRLQSR